MQITLSTSLAPGPGRRALLAAMEELAVVHRRRLLGTLTVTYVITGEHSLSGRSLCRCILTG